MVQPWWLANQYNQQHAVPELFEQNAGPHGPALVQLWQDGKTGKGWGLTEKGGGPGFMARYARRDFAQNRILYGYNQGRWAFAFIMRSLNVICLDIDGKNGGIVEAQKLLLAGSTPTLAETSKSGNGYHLFYLTQETWDTTTGFGDRVGDHISLAKGVDVRAVGCVYHYPSQKWNDVRRLAPLPAHLGELLEKRVDARLAMHNRIASVSTLDSTEILMLHADLINELNKPIPPGRRNNTLFAIGHKMKDAGVPKWDELLVARAQAVGLDILEAGKIATNVEQYQP